MKSIKDTIPIYNLFNLVQKRWKSLLVFLLLLGPIFFYGINKLGSTHRFKYELYVEKATNKALEKIQLNSKNINLLRDYLSFNKIETQKVGKEVIQIVENADIDIDYSLNFKGFKTNIKIKYFGLCDKVDKTSYEFAMKFFRQVVFNSILRSLIDDYLLELEKTKSSYEQHYLETKFTLKYYEHLPKKWKASRDSRIPYLSTLFRAFYSDINAKDAVSRHMTLDIFLGALLKATRDKPKNIKSHKIFLKNKLNFLMNVKEEINYNIATYVKARELKFLSKKHFEGMIRRSIKFRNAYGLNFTLNKIHDLAKKVRTKIRLINYSVPLQILPITVKVLVSIVLTVTLSFLLSLLPVFRLTHGKSLS